MELDRPGAGGLGNAGAKSALERTLLMLFLDCIEDPSLPAARNDEALTEARVRRMEDWIDVNFAEAIGIEDLARVAGVGVRSLQVACRRWRGCTPMELLRRRRLDAAREAILLAGPEENVTSVATGCGFFSFGRFAALYRARFGETPSQTLAARTRSEPSRDVGKRNAGALRFADSAPHPGWKGCSVAPRRSDSGG